MYISVYLICFAKLVFSSLAIYIIDCMSKLHVHFFYTRCIGEITSLSNHPRTLRSVCGHGKQNGSLHMGQSYELSNSERT